MLQVDLSNKTALVTGATGQLGRVIARVLAMAGADVIVHYHSNIEKAKEIKSEIEALGVKAYIISADVTDNKSVLAMAGDIASSFTMPDIIVNNSVIQYTWTSVLEQAVEDYESQFRSCVLHNVNMAKAFVPHMIENKYGRVIGINTECSMQNTPTQSAYVSGKRGMDGVMRVLAKEIGEHNITVNQVAPGWTISDNDRELGREKTDTDFKIPMKRRGTDVEVANAVAFLASGLADYITGVYLPVSGGTVMPTI